MIDIKFLRENPEIVKQNIRNKFQDSKLPLVDEVIALDEQLRQNKKRADDLTKLAKGELSDVPGGEGGESTDFTPSEPGEEGGGESNPEDAAAQLDNATQAPPEF